MKKVKCLHNKEWSDRLTLGKIYDVLEYFPETGVDDSVYIVNDLGIKDCFYIHIVKVDGNGSIMLGSPIFIEASEEYRNDIINYILE